MNNKPLDGKSPITNNELKELRRKEKEMHRILQIRKEEIKKYLVRGLVLLVIAMAVMGVMKLSQQSDLATAGILEVQDNDWTKGNINSTVTLIEYVDFECGACAAYYPLVERLAEEYGDDVLFVTRYFPLSGHKNSMTSALAVEAAARQGKYWQMHDLLFQKQNEWGRLAVPNTLIFEGYAEELGLNIEQFKQDASSDDAKNRIIRDRSLGNSLGVAGTPTFFLDGKKIQNPRGYEEFAALLDGSLKK